VSSRLDLRRGVVVSADPLEVEVNGVSRKAWADEGLLGPMREGDEVVVNATALDLGLGSGGFDVVHVNLTRGLDGTAPGSEHVMKLNYTSLQHPVAPVEAVEHRTLDGDPASELRGPYRPLSSDAGGDASAQGRRSVPVGVLPLHGYLAPAAWALAQARPGIRVGYVQTAGGALPGSMSRDVAELRDRDLLAGHITAGPAYGGEHEAISTVGALAAAGVLGWEAILVGPGPGIIGSDTEFGHGGIAALDSAHAALSLRLPTVLSPRLSSADPRERHRGLSHHTRTVLELLLAPVAVAVPERFPEIRTELENAILDGHHTLQIKPVDLDAYEASGLPISTMGRSLHEDPAFFAAPLASGAVLALPPVGGANTGTPRT
jgi:hypothetical protein